MANRMNNVYNVDVRNTIELKTNSKLLFLFYYIFLFYLYYIWNCTKFTQFFFRCKEFHLYNFLECFFLIKYVYFLYITYIFSFPNFVLPNYWWMRKVMFSTSSALTF